MRSREIACLLACIVAFGQTAVLMAAGHSGRVTLGGQAVPGAVVTVSQGDRRFTTTTDVQGNYQLPVIWLRCLKLRPVENVNV